MSTEPRVVLPNHELPACIQKDGTPKKSFVSKESAESYEKVTRERFDNEFQYAYLCELDSNSNNHWHLSKQPHLEIEDRSSAPFARSIFPIAADEETERFRSTSRNVRERREKVREVVSSHPDHTYVEIARDMGMDYGTLMTDVKVLIEKGLLQSRGSRNTPSYSAKAPAATKLTALEAQIAQLMAAKSQIEAQVAREEAERIERERVNIVWVTTENGEGLCVRKNKMVAVHSVPEWLEIIESVSKMIEAKAQEK